jgi:hypothetical protein
MKTLSVRFRSVVIGVIAIVAVVSCCNFPFIPDIASYSVEIGGKQKASTYVEWKNKHDFDEALAQVRHNGGKICICVLMSSHDKPYKHELNNDCTSTYKCPPGNIRTVKVTKSKVADDIAAGESAANDPNVMHSIQSSDPGDIKKVLDTLKN